VAAENGLRRRQGHPWSSCYKRSESTRYRGGRAPSMPSTKGRPSEMQMALCLCEARARLESGGGDLATQEEAPFRRPAIASPGYGKPTVCKVAYRRLAISLRRSRRESRLARSATSSRSERSCSKKSLVATRSTPSLYGCAARVATSHAAVRLDVARDAQERLRKCAPRSRSFVAACSNGTARSRTSRACGHGARRAPGARADAPRQEARDCIHLIGGVADKFLCPAFCRASWATTTFAPLGRSVALAHR